MLPGEAEPPKDETFLAIHREPIFDPEMIRFKGSIALFLLLGCLSGCKEDATVPTPTPPPQNNGVTYTDPPAYGSPFTGVPETKDIVMYEVNLRAFSTSGTFAGVTARLDSIKALGVNTIWLMPIYPVGQINSVGQLGSPYSVKNYKEVSPEYGNLDNLRQLVEQAHTRGMAVILDWVANHTSWDNPWIVNTTWYTKNQFGAITHPPGTNWLDVADLDYSSTSMRRAMINAMKYWILAANVDGYRCDYADGVPYDFWKQAIDSLKAIPGRELILLAEGARKDHFIAGFQLNYGWDYFGKLVSVFNDDQAASGLSATDSEETFNMPAGTYRLRFTANHDEVAWNDTPLGLFGGLDGSVAAFVLTAYMGGVPLIYNGQEVGCPVKLPFFSRSPIDWNINPDLKQTYKRLLSVRASSEAVKQGTLQSFPDNDVAAFVRQEGDEQLLVIVNTRSAPIDYTLESSITNTTWLDTMNGLTVKQLGATVSLAPFEYLILKKP